MSTGRSGDTCSIESVPYCQHYGVSCLSFQDRTYESLPMSVPSVPFPWSGFWRSVISSQFVARHTLSLLHALISRDGGCYCRLKSRKQTAQYRRYLPYLPPTIIKCAVAVKRKMSVVLLGACGARREERSVSRLNGRQKYMEMDEGEKRRLPRKKHWAAG